MSLEAELDKLREHLIKGQSDYGLGLAHIIRHKDGGRTIVTDGPHFKSVDDYDGGNPFCGRVRVTSKASGQAVWSCYYHGWLTTEATKRQLLDVEVFNFLRLAMQHPDAKTLLRGPASYTAPGSDYRYVNTLEYGTLEGFYGHEQIFIKGLDKPVYYGRYGGGLVNLTADTGEA